MVHIPCCDHAAFQDAFAMAFVHSAAESCPIQWTLLQCSLASSVVFEVELDDELNIFSCCSTRRHLRCMAPRLSAVGEEVSCPGCPRESRDHVSAGVG